MLHRIFLLSSIWMAAVLQPASGQYVALIDLNALRYTEIKPAIRVLEPARWGSDAHRLVNRAATTHLPADFSFFATWADNLERLSTAADERKPTDPAEFNKHFIDIDDYSEFFTGDLSHNYQDLVASYGKERVDQNGVVPWAIDTSYAELVAHFSTGSWEEAVAVAADIGHYVGDIHNPLHLTLNFNGQLTGQDGIHARYESEMTSRHLVELEPAPDLVVTIGDPLETVFEWIERQYAGLDTLLAVDLHATDVAGGQTDTDVYYDALWDGLGDQTIIWIRDASIAVASLWYAAWLEAGSPVPTDVEIEAELPKSVQILPGVPNPFRESTELYLQFSRPGEAELMAFDAMGRRVRRWRVRAEAPGRHKIAWDGTNDAGRRLGSGVYQLIVIDVTGTSSRGSTVLLR